VNLEPLIPFEAMSAALFSDETCRQSLVIMVFGYWPQIYPLLFLAIYPEQHNFGIRTKIYYSSL